MPTRVPSDRRLESCGEIANFLGVSTRTAQKWEQESGLPVHRLGGGVRPRVFALERDLEEWLANQTDSPSNGQAPQITEGLRRLPTSFGLILFIGTVSLSAVALYTLGPGSSSSTPLTWETSAEVLRVMRGDLLLWTRALPGLKTDNYLPERRTIWDPSLTFDTNGDGTEDLIFNFCPANHNAETSRLYAFDGETGNVLWEMPYGRPLQLGDQSFAPNFAAHFLRRVDLGTRTYLLAVANHQPWCPSQVLLMEPADGSIVGEYYHPGHLQTLAIEDLDADGNPELLLGGTRNPDQVNYSGVMLVLDLPFQTDPDYRDAFGNPSLRELGYVVFPRSDVHRSRPGVHVTGVSPLGEGKVLVELRDPPLFYELQFSAPGGLELSGVRHTTFYISEHKRLFRDGRLDHELVSDSDLEEMREIRTLDEFLASAEK